MASILLRRSIRRTATLRKAALHQTSHNYFINRLGYHDQYRASADIQQQAIPYDQAIKFPKYKSIRPGQALSPTL
jgi:hypothetical protein